MSQITYSVILVDCLNLLHRNWWPRRDLTTSTGVHTGMEYGFLSGIMNLMRKYPGTKIFLAWDGQPTRCRTIFPEYKLQRQPIKERGLEADWGPRIEILRDLLSEVFCTIYHPDTEADEEIARLAWYHDALSLYTLIFSNDKDIHQLATAYTHVCPFEKKDDGNDMIYDYMLIKWKWGCMPERIPLFRSLLGAGDASDGIRGIPRFPKKIALEMMHRCGDLKGLLELMREGFDDSLTAGQKEKLRDPANQELVARNYKLMELLTQKDQQINFCAPPTGDLSRIKAFCHKLELRSIIERPEWNLLGSAPGASNVAGCVSAGRSPDAGEI